jgi:hypothetical protein
VVDHALEFSSEMRWPSAGEMQQAVREAYERLSGSPIAAAAKLALGDDVPDRTIARISAMGPPPSRRVPTTARPVILSGNLALSSLSARARKAVFAVGGVAALAVIVLLMVGASGHSAPPVAASAPPIPVAPVAPAPPRPSSVVALSPVIAPEVSFDQLPAPAAGAHAAPRSTSASTSMAHAHTPSTATPSPVSSPAAQCQPPFVIDAATGKKRWKLECL